MGTFTYNDKTTGANPITLFAPWTNFLNIWTIFCWSLLSYSTNFYIFHTQWYIIQLYKWIIFPVFIALEFCIFLFFNLFAGQQTFLYNPIGVGICSYHWLKPIAHSYVLLNPSVWNEREEKIDPIEIREKILCPCRDSTVDLPLAVRTCYL